MEQVLDAGADLVADEADFFGGASFGVGEGPVVAEEAGDVRAVVSAAHGDEEVGVLGEFGGELAGVGAGEVEADLLHDGEDFGVDAGAGVGSGGDGVSPGGVGELIEEGGGHLGAAGVVDAGEDHGVHGGLPVMSWLA